MSKKEHSLKNNVITHVTSKKDASIARKTQTAHAPIKSVPRNKNVSSVKLMTIALIIPKIDPIATQKPACVTSANPILNAKKRIALTEISVSQI
jgi:hypothetical protein